MLDNITIIAISVGSIISIILAGCCVKHHVEKLRVEHENERLVRLNAHYNNVFKNKINKIIPSNFSEELKDESVRTHEIRGVNSV
jgi:hypothetical protein